MIYKKILFIFLLQVCFSVSWAKESCRAIFAEPAAKHDIAVEIEIPLNEEIVKHLTSLDGTLKSLFQSSSTISTQAVVDLLPAHLQSQGFNTKLDSLSASAKLALIQLAIKTQRIDFNQSRTIRNIRVREESQKKFDLQFHVEVGNPESTKTAALIELHIRSDKDAITTLKKAKLFHNQLGYSRGAVHMHVVFTHIQSWLKENPNVNIVKFLDYWRRINLAMEMRDVIENNSNIADKFDSSGSQSFGPSDIRNLDRVLRYLFNMQSTNQSSTRGLPESYDLRSGGKIGWIGLWGHDKYDKPDVMGFELRFLNTGDIPQNVLDFVASLKDHVDQKDFGLSEDKFNKWSELPTVKMFLKAPHVNGAQDGMLNALNPHQGNDSLMSQVSPEIRQRLLSAGYGRVDRRLELNGRFRYLVHQWENDPLFYGDPAAIKKIQDQRLRAIRRWMKGENDRQVVQDFLIESGIYFSISDSVGFKP